MATKVVNRREQKMKKARKRQPRQSAWSARPRTPRFSGQDAPSRPRPVYDVPDDPTNRPQLYGSIVTWCREHCDQETNHNGNTHWMTSKMKRETGICVTHKLFVSHLIAMNHDRLLIDNRPEWDEENPCSVFNQEPTETQIAAWRSK